MSKKLIMNNYNKNSQRDETVFAEYSFNNTINNNCLPARLTIDGGYLIEDKIKGNTTYRKLINLNKNAPTDIHFQGKIELLSVDYVNISQLKSTYNMFHNCTNLASCNVNEFDFSNVTTISTMFYNTAIEHIDMSKIDASNFTTIDNVFNSCKKLKTLILPKVEGDTLNNAQGLCYGCSSLVSVDMSYFKPTNLKNSAYLFTNCNNLSGEITIMNPNITNYFQMFYNTSTSPNSKFVVKYINDETKAMVEKLVTTKSANSNVFLWEGPEEPITDGLMCWLDGRDESGADAIWRDRSGNNNDGTLTGNYYWDNNLGLYGGHCVVKNLKSIDFSDVTIEMCFSLDNANGTYGIISNRTSTSNGFSLLSQVNTISMDINYNNLSQRRGVISGFSAKYFYKLSLIIKSDGEMLTYLDGNLYTKIKYNTYDCLFPGNIGDWKIGIFGNNIYSMSGSISYLKIYNRVLTEEEIKYNYLYEQSINRGE